VFLEKGAKGKVERCVLKSVRVDARASVASVGCGGHGRFSGDPARCGDTSALHVEGAFNIFHD
jgi:hypothetical protein